MRLLEILIGLLLLIISVGYLYRPTIIIRFNDWGRKYLFNDQLLITHRKKIGVVLLIIAIIFLYGGFVR
ncbi:hypothetical protein GTN66_02000 [bacterium]|nr:hypothetical protein [bacterium]NIN91988.1 hypothetical protein [bacterium]NIO18204.1 hypothetical protein [bacterium]NIO73178.1 hypothetical protein [bacterium]